MRIRDAGPRPNRVQPDGPRPSVGVLTGAAGMLVAAGLLCIAWTAPSATAKETSPFTLSAEDSRSAPDQRQIELFSDVVLNPSPDIDAETRRGMVEELLKLGHPKAIEPLHEALVSGRAEIMEPVIDVLLRLPTPEPRLINAAVDAFAHAPEGTLDALSILIGQYGDRGFERIAPLARDREQSAEKRLAPIKAIAAFRGRESVDLLMDLADPGRDEPAEVRNKAFESLRRLTGLDFEDDYDAWQDWWAQARELDSDEWLKQMIHSMSEQIAATEQRLQDERQAAAAIADRLSETLRELYRALPDDQQFVQLTHDLRDSMPVVREAAVDRLSRLLRDSVRLPEEVQLALVERLDDDEPVLRRKSARLLDELNYDGIGVLLAERLVNESDPRVAAEVLSILANRPTAHAVEPATQWLSDEAAQEPAATALWRLIERDQIDDDARSLVLDVTRNAFDDRSSPGLARLLATLEPDDRAEPLLEVLDHDDEDWRQAAAEGFRHRGWQEPLVERHNDDAIYPVAVDALTDLPFSLSTLDQLLAIAPSRDGNNSASRSIWTRAIMDYAGDAPPERLAEVDDRLRDADHVDRSMRIDVLARIEDDDAVAGIDLDLFGDLTVRLAGMLCDEFEGDRAYQLIERFLSAASGEVEPEDLDEVDRLHFRAALLADRYSNAIDIDDDVMAWLDMLESIASDDPERAARLADEIRERFSDQLDHEELAERLEAVRRSLPEELLSDAGDAAR